ncbi:TetR/AcrR family transcriptional regulator [Glacieibacterium megasporae]|uniref:TetR/AcrR family transcriptional regulator n=1 Tax=Glacieibacterium megasporae TaxID=2835787 RepID=UPI001C1E1233|nr:TetR/AcrR family transcriptional regulator [Polymorphobacter megasporae]UAJ09094.1 TetR/AcrR family transcriptional regulator [Polymorphobacter megasporae]
MSVQKAGSESVAPSTRRSAADRLCETATNLFYTRGIRAVGVDEIVHETGVTKPTLYRSYASKDDLIVVCLQRQIEDGNARWDAIATRYADDPLAELRAHMADFADEIAAPDYRGCAATNAAVEFPDSTHPSRMITDDCKAATRKRLGDLTRRLSLKNPDGLADGLMLLIEGASSSRHTSGSQGPSSTLVETAEMLIGAHLNQK